MTNNATDSAQKILITKRLKAANYFPLTGNSGTALRMGVLQAIIAAGSAAGMADSDPVAMRVRALTGLG